MPVLVTGGETAAGRAAIRGLLATGGEVRVYVDPADDELAEEYRLRGCKVARGAPDDEGRLELALEQAHTLVHLAAGPFQDPGTVLDEAATALSAAMGAGCRRIVLASHLGAGDPAGNAYLAACAETEAMLAEAPVGTVVLRRSLTYGARDAFTRALAAGVRDVRAEARHAPLYAGDLAAAVVAADRERGASVATHVTVPVAGPEVVTIGDLTGALGGRAFRRAQPAPHAVVDLLSRDAVPDELLADGTPLAAGLELTRAGAP